MKEEQNIKQLPEGWRWVKLKDISESIQYGYTESSTKEIIGPKFLRITDIQDNRVLWDEVPYCKIDGETKKKYLLKEGDLVFARTGATVGKSFLLRGNIPESVFASYLIRVRVSKEINEQYLSNFFHSTIYWSQITEGQVGIGQPNVNGSKLGQLNLPLPPLSTQTAVVAKIEELFSELDKGIENLRLAQQQLKTYRQAVLKWAFEGRLTNENVKDGELPEGWKLVKIEDATISLDNKRKPINKEERKKRYGNIPYYGANGQVGWIDDYIFDEPLVCVVEDETFTGREIPFSYKITGKTWVNNHAHVLKPKNNLNIDFLNYQLSYYPFLKLTTGTTGRKKLTKNALNNATIKTCFIEEQNKVVQEIESRLSVADKMEESINQSLQQAEALRQSILKQAFEGKLVAPETGVVSLSKQAKVIPIERKVLAAKIIHLFNDDRNFGLTKFQKTFFLVEHYIQAAYETDYLRDTAGPYDKAFTLAFRKEMEEEGWFTEEMKHRKTRFVVGDNVGSLIKKYSIYFREKGKDITHVLQLLKDKNTHEAELIATLYAVWNNRLIKKLPIKEDSLVSDFFNWSSKKREEFQEEEIMNTYKWMKEARLVPKGFGKVIDL